MTTRRRLSNLAIRPLLALALAACTSTVTPGVVGVRIDDGPRSVAVGGTLPLTATVTSVGGAGTGVTWSSGATGIASVTGAGVVTGVAAGSTTITARSTFDPTKGDTVTVTVTPPPTGTIAGTLAVAAELGASGVAVPPHADAGIGTASIDAAEIVPGDVIVGFFPGIATQSLRPLEVDGVRLDPVRSNPSLGVGLYRAPTLDASATRSVAVALAARPDVRYAHPNYVVHELLVPNDTFYPLQWHYPAIEMPAAWDITTGSASIVAAVVDSGILWSAARPADSEPDFAGKVLAGYDMIADFQSAGDGDGRDPDPFDERDANPHGSHVAGTVAAATNNSLGVAGVDWQAKLLPVRVLGVNGSGTLYDVVDGILWAAGYAVPGIPANPNPAHVINLSLGAERPCTTLEEDAFAWIAASSPNRAIVVAAAGNDDIDVAQAAPASCPNVITVGATETRDYRAYYSNYGALIDVMAPGGDTTVDRNGDGYADGVLSVVDDQYAFYQGTSMAAPHVTGVVSLMKALDADLTFAEALSALQATARPLDTVACDRPFASDCGAGLIDAAAALDLVQRGTVPEPGVAALVFDPPTLDFGTYDGALTVTLINTAAAPVDWTITFFEEGPANPGTMEYGSLLVSAASGTVPALGTGSVDVLVDRDFVTADGAYTFALVFEVGTTEGRLRGSFIKADTTPPTPTGPTIVAAYVEDAFGALVESGYVFATSYFDAFAFDALAGDNEVIAWVDENDDLEINEGDFLGVYPWLVPVSDGLVTSGVDVDIERLLAFGAPLEPGDVTTDAPWRASLEALARRLR